MHYSDLNPTGTSSLALVTTPASAEPASEPAPESEPEHEIKPTLERWLHYPFLAAV